MRRGTVPSVQDIEEPGAAKLAFAANPPRAGSANYGVRGAARARSATTPPQVRESIRLARDRYLTPEPGKMQKLLATPSPVGRGRPRR